AGWGVASALSQGGQQEAAAEGKEGQGFRGSYVSPQGAGGRKKKATKIRRWRVSQTCAKQWGEADGLDVSLLQQDSSINLPPRASNEHPTQVSDESLSI